MAKHKKLFIPLVVCAVALCFLGAGRFKAGQSEAKADWKWDMRPELVTLTSSQRNGVFYQGQPVVFQLSGTAARYTVRNYWGDVIEQGAPGTSLALKVTQPGWYKLYLYGNQVRQPWGDVLGGTNFCIFRDDSHFPKASSFITDNTLSIQRFGQAKKTRVDPNINFDWGNGAPAKEVGADNFRARWSGFVRPAYSEQYTFYTLADDGVRLFVNDRLLVDDWKVHGPTESQGTINLVAGKTYSIRVEYFEKEFGATVKLSWSSRSQPKSIISPRNLFLDAEARNPGLKAEFFDAADNARAESDDGSYYPSMDPIMRNITGMGPQRHFVEDAAKPDEAIAKLEKAIAIDKAGYLAYDPLRQRALMVAFPNGTADTAGVRKIVEHFKNDVKYWEPRNEPNGDTSGATYARGEMKTFYETVKSVSPTLKVLGPATVTIGPNAHGLEWIEDFLRAGGGHYINAFSFHAYNNVNGDLWLARRSLDSLQALLVKYGLGNIEKWQTEQGNFAAMYGAYLPRHQGNWTMLQMMVYEQYGIPKEHNHYWYDKSHGFWDQPTWWENEDGGLNPAAPLLRVWSEELYGARFTRAFDFGEPGNKLYIGNLFQGPGKTVAAFMSTGSPQGEIELQVPGASSLRVVSAFGVAQNIPVQNGRVLLTVPELPVYIELPQGQPINVARTDWGQNIARAPGVTALAPTDAPGFAERLGRAPIEKIYNGVLDNWYWKQTPDGLPWTSAVKQFPAPVEIRLPARTSIGRVVIYASPPWQSQSTLLDYELQWDNNGQWKTIEHVREPSRTFPAWTPSTRTSVDSFFSDRWIFVHHFQPVTTQKIRLLVHDVTWGGGATKDVVNAGGQTGPHQIVLREVEIYPR